MNHPVVDPATDVVHRLRTGLAGSVLAPDDPLYDEARRPFFAMFDRRPAAVVRPVSAADVAHALLTAREFGLTVAVRSGGHSPAGHSAVEGGVLIDLRDMRALEIDPTERTAWAGTGLKAGEFTATAAEHGLAVGFGDTGTVGIGGITLSGGVGYLHRKVGLTVDNVLAAEVVTATGEVVQADETTNPDLFWALRGGGGNFGVVTRFEYRLHEIDRVYGGFMILPATPARIVEVVDRFREAPDDVSGMVNVAPAPPLPFIPPEHHGRMIMMVAFVHAGDPEAGERFAAGIRALGTPLMDSVHPLRYREVFEQQGPPLPPAITSHSCFRDTIDLATAEAVVDALQRAPAPMRVVQFRVLGGAVGRVPADATAVPCRASGMLTVVNTGFQDPAQTAQNAEWGAGVVGFLRQTSGCYIGFMGDAGEAGGRIAYPADALARLAAVKARFDPENVFRSNQNVPPA